MIPVHLVEYRDARQTECLGKFLVGGFTPKVKWLLCCDKIQSIERSWRRREKFRTMSRTVKASFRRLSTNGDSSESLNKLTRRLTIA